MKQRLIAASIFFFLMLNVAYADPAPFDLEIGKATVDDVKGKYKIVSAGINKYSKGDMYDLTPSELEFDGLQSARVIFNEKNILMAVILNFPKNKFDQLLPSLNEKYKLISKDIPFVGNKRAKFSDGNTEIALNSEHLSFNTTLDYISYDLLKAFNDASKQENENKKKSESSKL